MCKDRRVSQPVRRVGKVVGGFALLGVGVIMLVTPGPGILAIAGGIGLLSTEFEWARRVRDRVEGAAADWRAKRAARRAAK
jgi:uncharacterized protein (TIGR02611 family)